MDKIFLIVEQYTAEQYGINYDVKKILGFVTTEDEAEKKVKEFREKGNYDVDWEEVENMSR